MRQSRFANVQRRRLVSVRSSAVLLSAITLVSCMGITHAATAVTWTNGTGSQLYDTPGNWDQNVVPNGDYAVTIGAPSPTVLNTSPTITALDIVAGGQLNITNGQSLSLTMGRSMALAGSIVINPEGAAAPTALNLPAFDLTLVGSGEIVLGSTTATIHNNGAFLNLPTTATIRGQGVIDAVVQNQGTILSNVSGGTITFLKSPGNGGTIEATNGGTIALSFNNSVGGKFVADNGVFRIADTVTLGSGTILNSANGGEFDFLGNGTGATISSSTINGTAVLQNGVNITVQSGFTNNGTIYVGGGSGFTPTGFSSPFDMTFKGTGQIVLQSQSASTISNPGAFLNNNAGHTIRGVGAIASNVLTNQGTIAADQSGGTLNVNGLLANLVGGTTSVSSGATMNVAQLSNSGAINIAGGGTLNATAFTSNYGTLTLGAGGGSGTLNITSGGLTINKSGSNIGSLTGFGTVNGDVTLTAGSDAKVAPGTATGGGSLTINGNLQMNAGTHLAFDIGGTTAGNGFDVIVDSSATFAGSLDVSLLGTYRPTAADAFVILTSVGSNTGTFSNIASGARLATTDGIGSFLVTYPAGGNTVTLSNYQALPEPATLTMLVGVPMLFARRRNV